MAVVFAGNVPTLFRYRCNAITQAYSSTKGEWILRQKRLLSIEHNMICQRFPQYWKRCSELFLQHKIQQQLHHCSKRGKLFRSYGLTYLCSVHMRQLHITTRPIKDSRPIHNTSARSYVNDVSNNEEIDEVLKDEKYREYLQEYYSIPDTGQRVFIIQPEVKWGREKPELTTPELQLAESCALVESLPSWLVVDKKICRVKSLTSRLVFGTGTLEDLTREIRSRPDISAVFLSIEMMSGHQLSALQDRWGIPVMDRYTVVLEIFKEHAKSKEAKLQVALAEIPYIRSRLKGLHEGTINRSAGGMQHIGGSGETFLELRRRLLQERELKLKKALKKVKNQREFLRKGRARQEFPIIAVVGYTNAGKTSLIKAVTGDKSMVPKNELFATLDVTSHAGHLPSKVMALFIDTVGFMSDIPTSLIDAFSATLEDALVADVIVHVRDISHPDSRAQRENVIRTLSNLLTQQQLQDVIEVCNKSDLLTSNYVGDDDGLMISATTGLGMDTFLQRVETAALTASGKTVRRLKIPIDGPHLSWLYGSCTVKNCEATPDSEHLVVEVIISEPTYSKFKATFRQKH